MTFCGLLAATAIAVWLASRPAGTDDTRPDRPQAATERAASGEPAREPDGDGALALAAHQPFDNPDFSGR